jgi:hypothetical protein
MSDAQRYRENAAECERLAQKSVGETTRASFTQMAAEWRSLAANAERREGAFKPPMAPANTDEPPKAD